MRRIDRGSVPAILLAIVVAGCNNTKMSAESQDSADEDAPRANTPIKFKGSPNAKLAGKWVSEGKDSIYDLGKDGKLVTTSVVKPPGAKNPQRVSHEGMWGYTDNQLYIKLINNGGETVAVYTVEQKGDTLKLLVPQIKYVSVFHRN